MRKIPDFYEQWEADGVLQDKLNLIKELTSKNFNQNRTADYLGMTSRTLIKLKQKYPKVKDALDKGKETKIYDLLDAMYRLAMGIGEEKTEQDVNEKDGKVIGKKVHKTTYKKLPNFKAIEYLLVLSGGKKYKANYAEYLLMKSKYEEREVWKNDETNRSEIDTSDCDDTDIEFETVREESEEE